jgi:ribosomal protein S18 acetylase RimI-like enzyme
LGSEKKNMNIDLRKSQHADIPFLREMLYEAVFWRDSVNKPSFEEGLAYPDVSKSLADWGNRDGDTAVVATTNSVPVGAAWYRFWTDDNFIRGYIDEITPVLVIGVHIDYRHQGIGTKMVAWLIDDASQQSIQEISLMVSKDNFAINLYRQHGFVEYADKGDAFIMVRKT